MCVQRQRRHTCCNLYPKTITDSLDLFAQPVYHFTFRDSYVVSTLVGSLCTCAFIGALVFVLFAKTIAFMKTDANSFKVNEDMQYAYYAPETEFDRHQIAVGLIYKPEYQDLMDLRTKNADFMDHLNTIADIEMIMQTKKDG